MESQESGKFSIGELSQFFGVSTRTIRFYEEENLLVPVREGSKRFYTQKQKTRLMLILRGKRLGFSLAEIRTIFDFYDRTGSDNEQLEYMRTLIRQKLKALAIRKEDIKVAERELKSTLLDIENAMNEPTNQG